MHEAELGHNLPRSAQDYPKIQGLGAQHKYDGTLTNSENTIRCSSMCRYEYLTPHHSTRARQHENSEVVFSSQCIVMAPVQSAVPENSYQQRCPAFTLGPTTLDYRRRHSNVSTRQQ